MPIQVGLEKRPVVGRAPVYSRCKQSCRVGWRERFLWSPPFLHRWGEWWSPDPELHRHSSGEISKKIRRPRTREGTSDEEKPSTVITIFLLFVFFLPASHSSSVWQRWSPVHRQWCGTLGGGRRGLGFWAASSRWCTNVTQTLTPVERLIEVLDLLIVTGFGQ